MRICSLLPSATEMVFALGAGESLVGVTHECDYPEATRGIAKITRSNIPSNATSGEIDALVSSNLQSEGTLYDLDVAMLERLAPDLIVTQRLCDVCAVSFDQVQDAAAKLPSHPRVLNLEPSSLGDILHGIEQVGEAIGRSRDAARVVEALQARVEAVRASTERLASRPRVFCMEWVDPPYCGGHWMAELVEIAGGRDDLARRGRPSTRIEWARVREFAPEVIVMTCCGFDLERCAAEGSILAAYEGARDLPAAVNGRIFATDGSAYFSRPGPRIVESLEILAHLIHPELFAAPPLAKAFRSVDLRQAVTARG